MRLLLETDDRAPYWLVGDPTLNDRTDQSSGMAEQIQVMRNQQVVTGADWETTLGLDRGNQQVTITCSTRRQFDSEQERMDYIAALSATNAAEQLHRWAGSVTVRVDDLISGTYRDYLLPDAVVGLAGMVLVGAVGLTLTYQVRAGGFGARSSLGTNGEMFNLTASDAGGIFLECDDTALSAAISSALSMSSNGVVELGMYRQIINATTGAIGAPALRGGTVLFFANAAAYDDYLGTDRSFYADLNVGTWSRLTSDGINFSTTWSGVVSGGPAKGCLGFTLPFSNARLRMLKQSLPMLPTVYGGVLAFGPNSAGLGEVREDKLILNTTNDGEPGTNARLWTLRLTRQFESSSGVVSYVLGDPIATFDFSFPGTVNLIAKSASGTLYNLTGFSF